MDESRIDTFIDGGIHEKFLKAQDALPDISLSNLIMFYDSNDIQLSTECDVVRVKIQQKYEFGIGTLFKSTETVPKKCEVR